MERAEFEALLEAALESKPDGSGGLALNGPLLTEENRQLAKLCMHLAGNPFQGRPLELRDPLMALPCF